MKINICLARFFNLLIISIVLLGRVLDYCPLQQGLRLPSVGSTENCLHSTRLLSITTRIKTLASRPLVTSFFSTRLLSITTRIKTQQSNMRALEQQRGTRLLSITTRIIPAV